MRVRNKQKGQGNQRGWEKVVKELAQVIEDRGLNQEQAAAAIGTKQTTLSGWLSGDHRPRAKQRLALAGFLGWPVPKLNKVINANYRKGGQAR
jgi:transcriptional regulator with XRE-family HTH domain